LPTYTAICISGLEAVLSRELEHLGLPVTERENGRVSFVSDIRGAAIALVGLRTAERVMIRLARFKTADFDQLFTTIRDLPWEEFCRKNDQVQIAKVRLRNSELAAQTSVQAVAHKAVYERLGSILGLARLTETGPKREVRLYLENNVCTVGLDLSGENLSRRGYRLKSKEAPLRETIAAALVLLSAWRRKHPLLDLFCGSGTIPIEAALFAMNKAPGMQRKFGLETMPCCPPEVFSSVRDEAQKNIRQDVRVRIRGLDHDPEVINMAKENAGRAGVSDLVDFRAGKMEEARPEDSDPGFILSNPPYGKRLQTKDDALAVWTKMAGIRKRFSGWAYGFIVNDHKFPELFGARPDRAWKFAGGAENLLYYFYRGKTSGQVK